MLTGPAVVLRLIATSHLLLMLALLLRDHRSDRSAVATAALIACVVGYLTVPVGLQFAIPQLWLTPLFLGAFSVPLAFWVLAKVHFDDALEIGFFSWLAGTTLLGVTYVSFLTGPLAPPAAAALRNQSHHLSWMFASKALGGAFVGHALFRVLAGARGDLVEARLMLRYVFLIVSGVYVLTVIVAEALYHDSPAAGAADTVNAALILLLVLAFSFMFTGAGAQFLKADPRARDPVSPELVERFHAAVDDDKLYREQGLTIAKLARRLNDYEHKVRQLINSDLGFKNFNAFLHHFRIRDARAALSDPAQAGRAIADIAFELGYQSLGPFNKAFKEITGQTPRDFRKSKNLNSPTG